MVMRAASMMMILLNKVIRTAPMMILRGDSLNNDLITAPMIMILRGDLRLAE